jgi:hypothetical protein
LSCTTRALDLESVGGATVSLLPESSGYDVIARSLESWARVMEACDNLFLLLHKYETFAQREFVREQVFVLGRMGNAKEALSTIINKLEDIQEVLT